MRDTMVSSTIFKLLGLSVLRGNFSRPHDAVDVTTITNIHNTLAKYIPFLHNRAQELHSGLARNASPNGHKDFRRRLLLRQPTTLVMGLSGSLVLQRIDHFIYSFRHSGVSPCTKAYMSTAMSAAGTDPP